MALNPILAVHNHRARGQRWRKFDSPHTAAVLDLLSDAEVSALRALCGRCLYHTLNHDLAAHGNAFEHVFVATGDIDAQWLRDSAVQLAIYLPRITAHPIIRPVSDPLCFFSLWRPPAVPSWHMRWQTSSDGVLPQLQFIASNAVVTAQQHVSEYPIASALMLRCTAAAAAVTDH